MANLMTGTSSGRATGLEAAVAMLAEIDGLPASRDARDANRSIWEQRESQDLGRKYLGNGGCFYIDLQHLEGCIAEVRSAFDHVAATHAMYRLAQRACDAVNVKLPAGQKAHVLATNSDGHGHSFGSHLSFLLHRSTWDEIFHRKPQYLGLLAAYQASSIAFTGLGKAGSENGRPWADYQISQRTDFIEVLCGPQTTFRRPLLNTRFEPLCGECNGLLEPHRAGAAYARFHVIFYDHNLCHCAAFLKVGVMQLALAMLESGQCNLGLLLEDPLEALWTWSHDPSLESQAALATGEPVTAVEWQRRFLEEAQRFAASGDLDDVVPDASMILELWTDTLSLLEAKNWPALSRRLDWVLKKCLLEHTLERRPGLTWRSPEIKQLDHLYSSLDSETGLYWHCERAGLVDRLVPEHRIERFVLDPPSDTRAWTRAQLVRLADPAQVQQIDWDLLSFRRSDPDCLVTLELDDPLGFTSMVSGPKLPEAGNLWDALVALGASVIPCRLTGCAATSVIKQAAPQSQDVFFS